MDIAIIGAGVAGLSCAYELEKHGIYAEIFEQNSYIGEQINHVGAVLNIIMRSFGDPIEYLKNKLGMEIKPINTVKSVIHNAPNKSAVMKGNLGYLFERSNKMPDIKNQIYSKLKKSKIHFSTHSDFRDLSKNYDYVVISNGSFNYTNELGCWIEKLNTYVRGAVVLGDFDPHGIIVWFNKKYCKNGYAYLTPFNSKRASLILVVTDITEKELDNYWELFIYMENIKYTIVDEYKLKHVSGNAYPHKIDNIFFAGNAAGAIDPFLGFGVINSVLTGVMAARSIIYNKDYEKLISPAVNLNNQLYQFRKIYDKSNNSSYDKLISTIGFPGIKQLLYNTPIDIVKIGAFLLKYL